MTRDVNNKVKALVIRAIQYNKMKFLRNWKVR